MDKVCVFPRRVAGVLSAVLGVLQGLTGLFTVLDGYGD